MSNYQHLSRSIEHKTAIITGAGSGMGRATAQLFAREGANVVITDINEERINALVSELQAEGFPNVLALKLDVSQKSQIEQCVEKVAAHFGGIDILVNNAGIALYTPIDSEQYDEHWEKSLTIMLRAHQWMVRAALPYLEKSESARIVNVGSTEAFGSQPGSGPYTVAKHGVIGFTRSLAVELGPKGITANAVCPGPVHTDITSGIKDEHKEVYAKRRVPLRRYGIPEEVAHMILSTCLPAASFMTGSTIVVDCGMLVQNG